VFYLDSSALVKRYLSETGSAWVSTLCDPEAGATIVIAEITRVEVAAALAARHRASGGLSQEERDRLFRLLVEHATNQYVLVPLAAPLIDMAMQLTQRHRLRGYDAVQLAAALDANRAALAAELPALTFVSADDDLNAAARAEGLAADNPNQHP
jgi:predicted nucleic acid-binding protein